MNATLTGFVRDASDAVVSGVAVVVTNQGTNLVRGLTWIHGAHSFKAGVDIRRHRLDVDVATHANNFLYLQRQFSGDGFADYLMGFPTASILELAPHTAGQFRATNQAYYILDNWKVAQQLHAEPRPALRVRCAAEGPAAVRRDRAEMS